jgi:hypothetical protein
MATRTATIFDCFRPLVVAAALCAAPLTAQNMLTNPGFEAGNVGFSSDYSYSSGGNCCEGQYTVRSTPNTFNGVFTNPTPSSPGSSLMMVINGATVPNQRVWYASVPVVQGETYRLQLSGCTAVAGGPAILQWQVAGQLIGTAVPLPNVTRTWFVHGATWTAPSTGTVEVAVRNLNINAFPNDFYIDDMFVGACTACWNNYGNGYPGAQGIPNLAPSAPPQLGTALQLLMTSASPNPQLGILALGLFPLAFPTPFGGNLLVQPTSTLALPVAGAPNATGYPLTLPSDPAFAGVRIFAQFAHTDPAASLGYAFSRGLELRLGL